MLITKVSVVLLSVLNLYCYTECRYCRVLHCNSQCHFAECYIFVVTLSVIRLSVAVLGKKAPKCVSFFV